MATLILAGESFELLTASQLTFAEARLYETTTGLKFGDLLAGEASSAFVSQAFIWLSMRREKPELKFSDLDSLSLDDFEVKREEEDQAEPADPTPPGEGSEPTD